MPGDKDGKDKDGKEGADPLPPKGPGERLIDAIEEGNVGAAKKALDEGASADERKKITLVVKWKTGEQRLVEKGGFFSSDKYEEVTETKQEARLMESVLGLAIRAGRLDLVNALLDTGRCDVNAKMAWRIPNWFKNWTEDTWNNNRWLHWTSFDFGSALEFALAYGKTSFNKKGSQVVLYSPNDWDDVRDETMLTPKLDIVKALVAKGATVTAAVVQVARRLKEGRDAYGDKIAPRPEFLDYLEPLASADALAAPKASGDVGGSTGSLRPPVQIKVSSASVTQERDPDKLAAMLADQVAINEEQKATIERLQADLAALQWKYEALRMQVEGDTPPGSGGPGRKAAAPTDVPLYAVAASPVSPVSPQLPAAVPRRGDSAKIKAAAPAPILAGSTPVLGGGGSGGDGTKSGASSPGSLSPTPSGLLAPGK